MLVRWRRNNIVDTRPLCNLYAALTRLLLAGLLFTGLVPIGNRLAAVMASQWLADAMAW